MRQRSKRQGRAYAAIPNAAMRDTRISIEARGLLALLMTYSDDWTFVVDHLQQVTGCGRDKMRGMLKELAAAGYVVREVLRGKGGHVAGTEWMIVDDPATAAHGVQPECEAQDGGEQAENQSDHRPPENPSIGVTDPLKNRQPVEPTAGKSAPIRRTISKNTKSKNTPNPSTGSGAGCAGFSDDDFEKFWAEFPEPVERDAARKAFGKVIAEGEASAEDLIIAAGRYAASGQVDRGYVMKPANWLLRGSWREPAPADPPSPSPSDARLPPHADVDVDAVARSWVGPVKAGRTYAASGIKPAIASHMVATGLVTQAELRRVGVSI